MTGTLRARWTARLRARGRRGMATALSALCDAQGFGVRQKAASGQPVTTRAQQHNRGSGSAAASAVQVTPPAGPARA